MRVLILDNYDSFTYNLVQYLGELGAEVVVRRNDEMSPGDLPELQPDMIVISPGPCTPNEAGISLSLLQSLPEAMPLLGVCLGHQAIGQAYGAEVVRAAGGPVHGKTARIHHDGEGVYRDLEQDFLATRYHSLVLRPDSIPDCLEVTSRSEDGVIMGVRHRELPVEGVQFHPESVLTDAGKRLLANFLGVKHPAESGGTVAGEVA